MGIWTGQTANPRHELGVSSLNQTFIRYHSYIFFLSHQCQSPKGTSIYSHRRLFLLYHLAFIDHCRATGEHHSRPSSPYQHNSHQCLGQLACSKLAWNCHYSKQQHPLISPLHPASEIFRKQWRLSFFAGRSEGIPQGQSGPVPRSLIIWPRGFSSKTGRSFSRRSRAAKSGLLSFTACSRGRARVINLATVISARPVASASHAYKSRSPDSGRIGNEWQPPEVEGWTNRKCCDTRTTRKEEPRSKTGVYIKKVTQKY